MTSSDWAAETIDALAEDEQPESEDAPSEMAEPLPPVPVIVVGSFDWDNPAAVHGALRTWLTGNAGRPAVLYTSGCPHGAEAQAVEFGTSMGWQHVALRDEELVLVPAPAFVFIRGESAGASALADELRRRTWTRIMRDDTYRVLTRWADR